MSATAEAARAFFGCHTDTDEAGELVIFHWCHHPLKGRRCESLTALLRAREKAAWEAGYLKAVEDAEFINANLQSDAMARLRRDEIALDELRRRASDPPAEWGGATHSLASPEVGGA